MKIYLLLLIVLIISLCLQFGCKKDETTAPSGTAPQAPTLSSPSNDSTNLSIPPTLIWHASNNALTYTLQLSPDSSFSVIIYSESGLEVTTHQVTGLSNCATYYWRVNATNSFGTSVWSSVWNFTTRAGAAPGTPNLVSPVNGSINQSTTPILIWKGSTCFTSYILQVSTNSSFTNFVYNQSGLTDTSQQVSSLNGCISYYWRVSATNIVGNSVWSSVWNFTTQPAVTPDTPILMLPLNNGTNLSTTPTLYWSGSACLTNYTLQVSTDSSFSSFVYNQSGLVSTSQQVSGLSSSTMYYWRVNATNIVGTSNWSSVWNFSTVVEIPTLLSPTSGSVNIGNPPTLFWNASNGATSYTLQVSANSSFTSYIYNQSNLTSISQEVSGLNNCAKYYWRVNATNVVGTSNWSSVWNFTTQPAVTPPNLVSPTNGSANLSPTPTLTWSGSTCFTSYTLQVSTDTSFASYVYNQSNLTSTSQQISGLSNSTMYYWRVNATNIVGTSNWSSVWNFTTAVEIPTLSSPVNGSVNIAIPPTLVWNAIPGITSYTLQVSANSSFTSFAYNQSNLTSTSQQITDLTYYTTYYWRVNAKNGFVTSNWSSSWSFRTQSGSCSGTPTVSYAGKTYNTVQIGNQCWLKENLDIGIRIDGKQNQTNNHVIEKYCYNNDPNNCNIYGGLYQWDETMQYSTTPGTQGICPPDWHIPTNAEYQTLSTTVGGDGNALKAIGQGTGDGVGTNTSGFSALLAGYLYDNGYYNWLEAYTIFWSSTVFSADYAYYMAMQDGNNNITLFYNTRAYGYSVRCVKD